MAPRMARTPAACIDSSISQRQIGAFGDRGVARWLGIRGAGVERRHILGLGEEAEPGQRKMRDPLARGRHRLDAKCPVERGRGLVGDKASGIPAPPGGRFRLGDHAGDVGDLPGFELSLRRPQLDPALAGGRVVDPAANDLVGRGGQLLITSPRRDRRAGAALRPRTLHPGPMGTFEPAVRTYGNLSALSTRSFPNGRSAQHAGASTARASSATPGAFPPGLARTRVRQPDRLASYAARRSSAGVRLQSAHLA